MAHTPRLLLKAVHCVTDTEGGGESPYFLITVGSRGANPKLFHTVVRVPDWDNQFDQGTRLTTHQLAASSELSGCPALETNSLVLVSLIEEDVDRDLGPSQVGAMTAALKPHWLRYGGPEFANVTTPQLAEYMLLRTRPLLESLVDNDDVLGTRHLPLTTLNGELGLLSFSGGGGLYRARFEMDIPGA